MSFRIFNRRNAVLCAFCFALLANFASAQSGWNQVKRGGTGDLVAVFFTSSDKGWVGGDNGYLARTTDGGRTWMQQTLNSEENVNEIYFRNDKIGYLLAGRRIYITRDGGDTWRENIVVNRSDFQNGKPEFLSLRFTDKKRGWIVGSVSNQKDEVVDSLVLHTTDGGETWQRVVVPAKQELYHLAFVSNSEGWIAGDKGLILATTDGGESWIKQDSGTTASLYNVSFRDSESGIAVGGEGTIIRTEDGGRTWVKARSNFPKSLLRVSFTDDRTAWAVGSAGTILRTDDAGRTWVKQNSQTADSLYGLFINRKNGWAVGKKGTILQYQR